MAVMKKAFLSGHVFCIEGTDIEGLFYQLIDNRKGIRISYGSVDIDRIAEEISEYQKNNGGKSYDINK